MTDGPLLFARYAYPPNALGYCGPPDHRALLEYGATGSADRGLRELIGGFENAPYFRLIAGACGISDPLDPRVVEAYWVGNDLLERVSPGLLSATLEPWLRGRAGTDWDRIVHFAWAGGVPHHSFHVFGVYPWVGLLRAGKGGHALEVLERCRIRWGTVVSAGDDLVRVRSRPLEWDGRELRLGPLREKEAVCAADGYGFVGRLRPGEVVALHWGWVCDRLSPQRLAALRRYTSLHLAIANGQVADPGAREMAWRGGLA